MTKYTDLITSEHNDKPNYLGVVETYTDWGIQFDEFFSLVNQSYDLDQATGIQLDAVGMWVGISRVIETPLSGIYLTWNDVDATGWEYGSWQGPFDPDTGLTSLPDDAYRLLIKAKILANQWDGTVDKFYAIWNSLFGIANTNPIPYFYDSSITYDSLLPYDSTAGFQTAILLQDYQDMSFGIVFIGIRISTLNKALIMNNYLNIKPAGVGIKYYGESATQTGKVFAWNAESNTLAGWDSGEWFLEY